MKKKYCEQTHSSLQKLKDPVITRSKLDRLTGEVKKLQMKTRNELSYKDSFERESIKVSDDMANQMNMLKSSFITTFNSLSDIMVEEFESIRTEMQNSSVGQCCPMQRTIEHLTLLCSKYESDMMHLHSRMDKAESYISKIPTKDLNEEIEIIKSQILSNKSDYKSLYDQMTDIINTINEEMDVLRTEQDKINESFKSVKNSILDINQSVKISKSMFLNNSNVSNKENAHPNEELNRLTKDINDVKINLSEQLEKMKGNNHINDFAAINESIKVLECDQQKYLKNQLDTTVLKTTFEELENTFYSIHCEHKIIQKKVQAIEEISVSQRKEFYGHLAELEKFVISKNETMKQTISQICRNLGIDPS